MRAPAALFIVSILLAVGLAGCLGSDAPDPADDPADVSAPGTGTVKGMILTVDLEPVRDAQVNLARGSDSAGQAATDAQGRFTITGVEPGEYQVQIISICCRQELRRIEVAADQVTELNLQLTPYTGDELQQPRVEHLQWTGFLACTVRWPTLGVLPYSGISACSLYDPTGMDDFLHTFDVRPGLMSIVGGMTWSAPGAALGEELTIYMEVNENWNEDPRFVHADGASPLEFRVDAGDIIADFPETVHHYDFENLEGTVTLAYRVFAGGEANVVYQQPFTVYWDLYYWAPAPEGASALPG